jgi:DNA helicase MCM9
VDYIAKFEVSQIRQLLEKTASNTNWEVERDRDAYAFDVNTSDLVHVDPSVAFAVLHFPNLLLPIFNEAVIEAQQEAIRSQSNIKENKWTVKTRVTARIHSLPPVYQFCRGSIGLIRSLSDATALLQVCGTVVRTGAVRLLEKSKTYQCMKQKCMHKFVVFADPEQGNVLPTPKV